MARQRTTTATRHITRVVVAVVLVCVLACAVWFMWGATQEQTREQGALSVRNAVMTSATQCAAVEGAYPSSLSYLEEHYGLVVNHDDYVVTYEVFATNVAPSVVVMPR